MDIEKLKAEHSALYNQIFGLGAVEGAKNGIKTEQDRVNAHLAFAEKSGDFEFAAKAIKEGTAATDQAVFAHHMAAGIKQEKIGARASEQQNPGKPKGKTDEPTAAGEPSAETVDKIFEQLGANLGKDFSKKTQ